MKKNLNVEYNYDFCYNEAKKYTTFKDFRKNSKEAARAARYRGWEKDYTWLESTVKPKGYWNKETCKDEAIKHKTIKSFHDNSGGAYTYALKNGWINDYTWLERETTQKGFYTEERCLEEAKKYDKLLDFRKKSRGYYEQAKSKGWLSSYDWLVRGIRPKRYWNEETCREASKECKTFLEFRNKYKQGYHIAKVNGWLDTYSWLDEKAYVDIEEVCDNVYAYIFEDQKLVYVGRTKHLKTRHKQHTQYTKHDTIYKFIHENNLPIPNMIVLEKDITIKEGLEKEHYWINFYRDSGYDILNKKSTGVISGSVGGLGCGKNRWDNEEACYNEAKKYKSRTEFSKKKNLAYIQAIKHGWIDKYDWFVPKQIRYTYDICYNEAKKYKTIKDFRYGKNRYFFHSKKNGWLETFTWLEEYIPINDKDRLYVVAKKYTKVSELQKGDYDSYTAMVQSGRLKDFDWLEKDRTVYTYEECYDVASKYTSIEEFEKNAKAWYKASKRNKWIESIQENLWKK